MVLGNSIAMMEVTCLPIRWFNFLAFNHVQPLLIVHETRVFVLVVLLTLLEQYFEKKAICIASQQKPKLFLFFYITCCGQLFFNSISTAGENWEQYQIQFNKNSSV